MLMPLIFTAVQLHMPQSLPCGLPH